MPAYVSLLFPSTGCCVFRLAFGLVKKCVGKHKGAATFMVVLSKHSGKKQATLMCAHVLRVKKNGVNTSLNFNLLCALLFLSKVRFNHLATLESRSKF